MTKEDFATKIEALLAKAQDPAATPAEAEAYTAKAEALMVKWGISDAELEAKRRGQKKGSEKIVTEIVYIAGAEGRNLLQLAFAVGEGLGIRVLQSSGKGTMDKRAHLIGFESDVKRVKMLYESLAVQALHARAVWYADLDKTGMSGNDKFLAKRQFVWSFASVVGRRLRATRETAVEETKGTGTELVLVDRKARLDEHMAQMKVGKGRSVRSGGSTGRTAGREAGERANLGTNQVDTGAGGAISA